MSIKIRIASKFKEELNGRLLLFIDRPGQHLEEMLYKRNGFGEERSPVFGVTFYGLKGGDEIDLDLVKDRIFGSPIQFDEIPKERLQFKLFSCAGINTSVRMDMRSGAWLTMVAEETTP